MFGNLNSSYAFQNELNDFTKDSYCQSPTRHSFSNYPTPKFEAPGISSTFERELIEKESLRNKLHHTEKQRKYLRKENEKHHETIKDLESKNEELSSQLIKISSKYKILKTNYQKLKAQAIDTQESINKPQESKMKQTALIKSLMNEVQEKREQLTMKNNELNDTKILLSQIKNQLSIEQTKTKHLTEDINTLKERLEDANTKVSEEKRKRKEIAKTATGALADSAQSTLTYEQMVDKLQN